MVSLKSLVISPISKADCSPLSEPGEDFVHGWVLGPHVVDDVFDHLVPRTLLLKIGTCLVLWHWGLIAV